MAVGSWGLCSGAAIAALLAVPAAAQQHPASLVGHYDGHQMEIGAELVLKADGRFDYGLAYGALDESAEGRWALVGDHVVLTGDPVTPPRFVFLGQQPAPRGTIKLTVEAPQGMAIEYFDAALLFANGQSDGGQFGHENFERPIAPGNPPVRVALTLPMFEVRAAPVAIDPARGYWLRFRFEPHDIGKVAFDGTILPIDKGDLILDRLGRTIRFHRDGG